MLILRGGPALSPFRKEKLLAALKSLCPDVAGLHAEHVHFLDVDGAPDPAESERLDILLDTRAHDPARELAAATLRVVPRPGTVSPLSSKATDILHNCRLTKVRRVERGSAFWLEDARGAPLSVPDAAAALLHDRMTQVALPSAQ